MKQSLFLSDMKLFTALFPVIVFLCSCSSTYSIQGAFTYEEINRKLKGEEVNIELTDGKEIHSTQVRISRDSVSWFDQTTGEESKSGMEQLNRIVVVRKNRFLGACEGLLFGAVGGAGIGWLMTNRRDYDEGLLLYNMIVQGGIWGGVGLITGAIIGHSDNWEFRNIRIKKSSPKTDVLYLKNGTIVRGTILAEEEKENSLVRVTIRSTDGEIHTFYASQIERIERAD